MMYLLKKKRICSTTTWANYRNTLLTILFISNILFELILWMIFIISRRVIDALSSINKKSLNSSMSFINIVDENEKWILNIISILSCAVMINFSRFFNDEIIIYNIISFFASLIHFVTSKNFFESFSEICISARKLFFLCCIIILFFRSQILTYVCHSSKMRHSRFKRRVFLIMSIYSWNHSNFARSWDLVQDVNYFVIFLKVYKNVVV